MVENDDQSQSYLLGSRAVFFAMAAGGQAHALSASNSDVEIAALKQRLRLMEQKLETSRGFSDPTSVSTEKTMTSTYTVEKIAAFVDGCSNSAIQKDLRDLVARHLLDSIGCAIGAIGAKVTHDIRAVVDAFGGKQICTCRYAPSSGRFDVAG